MLMDTELDATQQDFVMTAQESGKVLIQLINEVLDQARIESGRLELEAVPFDIRDLLDNVLSLFSDKSQVKGIEVKTIILKFLKSFILKKFFFLLLIFGFNSLRCTSLVKSRMCL
jgi:signal transduction histidine kinase